MTARDPFAVFRARLDAIGWKPSRSLGQNFLLDPSLHRWIADQAGVTAADTVVEIGVGLGFLTRELATRAATVVAVEIDERLLEVTRGELGDVSNVGWVLGDALGGPGRSLHPAIVAAAESTAGGSRRCLVVANLPYAVSGPLLAELALLPVLPARCVLLVQKELAQRLAAASGDGEFGGLSALVQSAFTVRLLRDVPPQVFRPRPKVVSSVLELVRRSDGPLATASGAERRQFAAFLRQLFQQRRKALRTTLPAAAAAVSRTPPALSDSELARRAESVDPDTLGRWWLACGPLPPS
jgi:16S rRNA (adenine1518-N6/adenine1519-N6)-dimethyltransferase